MIRTLPLVPNSLGLRVYAQRIIPFRHFHQLNEISKLVSGEFLGRSMALGQGSNVLFSKDYDGLLIQNLLLGIQILREDADYVFVEVCGGVVWDDFVLWAVSRGFGGIENLSLIPGSVGAAPVQNIGAYGVEVGALIQRVHFFDWESHRHKILHGRECVFSYRNSIFKQGLKNRGIITSVVFRLNKEPRALDISYRSLRQELEDRGLKAPTIRDVSQCVRSVRMAKLPRPDHLGNAGSFFKNPKIHLRDFLLLKEKYPDIPHFPIGTDAVKLSAAWLISEAGFRGFRDRGVAMYWRQPLVLVNYGAKSGEEVLEYISSVQSKVEINFGVMLVPEVNII